MNNFLVRLVTGLIGAPIILAILYLGPSEGYFALVAGAMLIATWEFFGMSHPDDRTGRLVGTALTLGIYLALVGTRFGSLYGATALLSLSALTPIALLFSLARPQEIPTALPRVAALVMGPLYMGVPMAMLALIRTFGTRTEGAGLVVVTLMCAWMSDTAGYIVGKSVKGPKLYPAVSPGKTWSGAVGGLGGSIFGAVLAHFTFLPTLPLFLGMLVAGVAGVAGQAGDLCESVLKRSAGVKDSGGILPGHGGILDRIDALVFCAVTVFFALHLGWLTLG